MPSPHVPAAPLEFDPVIKLLHWLTLALIIAVFALAFSIDAVPTTSKQLFLQLHRSFGVTIWIVTLGRLIWRQFTRFPNWPATMSRPMRVVTNASEYALYALLLIQPVLGLIQTSAHGDRVKLFFLVNLSPLTVPDPIFAKQVHEVHGMVGYGLLALIGMHAATGLYHHFWRRDDTLTAMLPHAISLGDKAQVGQRVTG
jgi:superoxide oxidase